MYIVLSKFIHGNVCNKEQRPRMFLMSGDEYVYSLIKCVFYAMIKVLFAHIKYILVLFFDYRISTLVIESYQNDLGTSKFMCR